MCIRDRADAGPGQVEMIARPQKNAPRRRERTRKPGAICHGVKGRQLHLVHRMVRLVGARQMRHQKLGACIQHEGRCRLPFRLFHAKAVHAGVQLYAKGMAGQRFQICRLYTSRCV